MDGNRQRWQRGSTLPELIVSLAVMGLTVTMSGAALDRMYRRAALRTAAVHLRKVLQDTQLEAHIWSGNCAVKFTQHPDGWYYRIYRDGNGNGVTNSDITKNIDPPLTAEHPLLDEYGVGVGLLPGESDPDGGPILTSPLNFNRSTLCSFSQIGTATPGTVYLTNGSGAAAVRSNDEGTIRVLLYVPETARWVDL